MNADNEKVWHELVLACESWQEAQRLTDALLQNELVKAVESLGVQSRRWWEQPTGQKYEVRLVIQTLEQDVAAVKQEIVHLRRTATLSPYVIPFARLSKEVSLWLHRATEVKSATLKR